VKIFFFSFLETAKESLQKNQKFSFLSKFWNNWILFE